MQKEALREREKKRALNVSINEGTASAFSADLGNSLITPLATEIGANAFHIGLLNSFSGLISPIAQIKGDRLMEKHSRRKITTKYALLQAISWLPIILIGFLYYYNIISGILPWILIVVYSLISGFGGLVYPAWFSWMGDLVKKDERGKYFAKRNVYAGIATVTALIFGGLMLKYFKSAGMMFIGFGALFLITSLFRFVSYIYLKKQYEPTFRLKKESYFSFFSFIKRFDNYGKFAVYQSFFNFAIMIASPFFAFYMLKNLGYENNYLLYMVVTLSSMVFYLIFTPLAGKLSDKYGNLKLLWISNFFFGLTPVLWLFVKSPLAIIFIPQLSSGIANAALAISVTNYTYDSVSKEKRGLCIAYTNLLIGIGTFAGAIIGGVLISYVNISFMNSFFFVFILAAVARFLVGLFFLPKLKEVKPVSKLKLHVPIHLKFTHHFRFLNFEQSILGFAHSRTAKSRV